MGAITFIALLKLLEILLMQNLTF